MADCKYGDPTCPCQDGDVCHYEGANPMTPPTRGRELLDKFPAEAKKAGVTHLRAADGVKTVDGAQP